MRDLIDNILPSDHRYWGLSIGRVCGAKIRILLKFIVQASSHPVRRMTRLRRLRGQRGAYSGQTVLVLGLGPSVSRLSPDVVAAKQSEGSLSVVCVNNFFRSDYARVISPDIYVLADPHFFGRDRSDVDFSWKEVWDYLEKHPEISVFIPDRYSVPAGYVIDNLNYFNSLGLEGFSTSVAPTRPRGFLSMTAYHAISIVGYLGYSRILMAGIDNTQFRSVALTPQQKPGMGRNHFYEAEDFPVEPLPHFNVDGMAAFFEDVARLFADLRLFKHLPIENLDPATLVDVFPIASDWLKFSK
ncbi:hypothetical protein [Arthrobacter sp. STN4]|uniref:hypothetical protein n=1 Tax=Arthrobacter sp. STN4 TaxID=2923276 RepID=UPI00211A2D73|nr:hypothetical protein [Arthrobacter sp. STN4]MCQ9163666.1 hypothetical protein [Arthrobacter sp. STN4]